ncbi:MAG: hypothetical protein CFH16_01079 [Alphaproteobacteria bacterium MarineAlpha5_Bin6]|nr:MAG: hypothetical protein CFH17_00363 [Alphaproteobacteria bacterium MarineAlpha5_Bin7]PPR53310.1 MAG: hypothetical protein CFH16_01079 [Alphaproteobacteria bacterium MarineAlpha5_Bin6]|tara:strand:- start:4301 stop:5074 length:774 start_codon:yes stop_codon:yes gene_type:complete
METKLFFCKVIHERFIPFKNRFKYNVLSIFIDYDEINYLSKKIFLFSYNKLNLFSFNEKDHGFRDGQLLNEYVKYYLKENKIKFNHLKIKILCFPRILGYVFNPLSVIYCFDNNRLISIFYEVKNTPNEQHTYIFANKKKLNKSILNHQCNKNFYVSPFIEMNCKYKFNNKIPNDRVSIIIEVFDQLKNKILLASQTGKRIKFNSFSILKYVLFNPLVMYKIIFLILYQSVVIMFKGGKYYSRKQKKKNSISFEGNI